MKKKSNVSKPSLSKKAKLTLIFCLTFVTLFFSITIIKRETTINSDARLLDKESPYKKYSNP
tara:strand:- start:13641 stop:13826 length:186 start_codon:yes stop_codon:yes gene_type:complete